MEGSQNWFSKGLALYEDKEYASALAAFDRAIMYNQSPGEAWYNRGLVCRDTGNYPQALHSFDQSLLYRPDDDEIKKARGAVLELMDTQDCPRSVSDALSSYQPIRVTPNTNRAVPAFPRLRDSFSNPLLIVFLFILLILVSVMSAIVFGTGSGVTGSIHHTGIVSATAIQPGAGTIMVTYQGGEDAARVNQMIVMVTDSEGTSQTDTMGKPDDTTPLRAGSSISFTGRFVGKDHVVATAQFMDGSGKKILDMYL